MPIKPIIITKDIFSDLNNYPGARTSLPPSSKPLVPNYNMFNNSMTVSETDIEAELLQKLNSQQGMMENEYEHPHCKDIKEEKGNIKQYKNKFLH